MQVCLCGYYTYNMFYFNDAFCWFNVRWINVIKQLCFIYSYLLNIWPYDIYLITEITVYMLWIPITSRRICWFNWNVNNFLLIFLQSQSSAIPVSARQKTVHVLTLLILCITTSLKASVWMEYVWKWPDM